MSPKLKITYLILFLFLWIGVPCGVSSQQSNIDSVNHLLKLSYSYAKTDLKKAEEVTYTAIELSKKMVNDTLLAQSYIEMSFTKNNMGLLVEATDYAFKALEIYESYKHYSGTAKAFLRIAWSKLEAGEHEDVFEYLNKAQEAVNKTSDSTTISRVYHSKGNAFNWIRPSVFLPDTASREKLKLIALDSAVFYQQKAIEIRRRNQINGLDNTLNNMAISWKDRGKITGIGFDEAEKYYLESFHIRKNRNDSVGMAASYINLGQLCRNKNDFSGALNYLWKGKTIAEKTQRTMHKRIVYQEFYHVYSQMQQYDSALFYYQKTNELQNYLQSNDYKKSIKEIETKYEVSQKDKEILLQQQKLKTQRMIIVFVFVVILILAITSVLYYKLYRKNKRLSERNAILLSEQNHRVKNNLQIISGLLSLQANRVSNENARSVMESSQLRIETMGIIHKKLYKKEIESMHAHEFVDELVQKVLTTYGYDHISIDNQISKIAFGADKATYLGLIINELVSNSCKHAFPLKENPSLKISMHFVKNRTIQFIYHDNGPGFHPSQQKTDSLGLKLINIQVEQLDGIASWQKGQGTTFVLEFKN
ncbi:MAG: histidine kinase dimerization/phosphoacceptor domain -containing protein [Bacteroidota bacterium]